MAQALEHSHLTWLADAPWENINGRPRTRLPHSLKSFAMVFTTPPDVVGRYFKLLEANQTGEATDAPKAILGRLWRAYVQNRDTSDLVVAAQHAAVVGYDLQASIDPHKLERAALEIQFLNDQAAVLFSANSIHNSPFAQRLRQLRDQRTDPYQLEDLHADAQSAFKELSEPIIGEYRWHNTRIPLTRKQRYALRFQEISIETAQLKRLNYYVHGYSPSSGPIENIWSVAQDGAAVSDQVCLFIGRLTEVARNHWRQTGSRPSPGALYQLALEHRGYLIHLETVHIDAILRATSLVSSGLKLSQETEGELRVHLPVDAINNYARTQSYDSPVIGCAALRAISPTVDPATRRGAAMNTLVDYATEAILDEASKRGLYDI